jgi:hypothetical protein
MCTWVPLVGEYTTREKLIPTHHKGLSPVNLGSPVTYKPAVMSGIKVIPEKVRRDKNSKNLKKIKNLKF